MRTAIAILGLLLSMCFFSCAALADAAPYVSCIDGHIVVSLDQCPPVPQHKTDYPKPIGGGGRSGLLGLGIGGIL